MVFWVFISCALACDLPHLPPFIDYFSPSFLSQGHLEASGRFISSNVIWDFEVTSPSWIRIVGEPKRHSLDISLLENSIQKMTAVSPTLGIASFAGKISPGSYQLQITIEESDSDDSNIIDCELPNIYLVIGISPYSQISQYKSKKYSNEFPDISVVNQGFLDVVPFETTFEDSSIASSKVTDGILISYPIKVPKIENELLNFGFTGLWEMTFTLRNS